VTRLFKGERRISHDAGQNSFKKEVRITGFHYLHAHGAGGFARSAKYGDGRW